MNAVTRSYAALLALGVFAGAPARVDADSSAPSFESVTPCPFEAASGLPAERLSCGWLSVPENRDEPDSATLRLPVAVIHSADPEPQPDPVVFIAGGPGASPTSSPHTFTLFASHAFGSNRDIVIYTQRGAEGTQPELRCNALTEARRSIYFKDQTLQERDTEIAAAARDCLLALRREGRDLRGYSALENAADLRDLRRALGVQQWNLMSVSYGTLIALEAVRIDPEGVRSLVLDSVVSPESDLFMSQANRNFSRGLGRVFEACTADAACNARFPDLPDSLNRVLDALRARPPVISLTGPEGTGPVSMTVNWHDFLNLVHWMLYNAKTLTLVPLLIDETAAGRPGLMTALMDKVFPAPANGGGAGAAFFATVCEDQYSKRNPLPEPEPVRYGGFAITSFMSRLCADPALPYGEQAMLPVVTSDVPALLLSGRFDPMTPDLYAQQAAAGLSHSTLVKIRNFGHSTLSGYTACQTEIADAFIDDPEHAVPLACQKGVGPPEFPLTVEAARALVTAPR